MNINQMLKPHQCSCGKIHRCDIKYVFIENNAVSHLSEMCRDYENILIVADENTFLAAGKKCEKYLTSKNIVYQIFSGKTVLIPDEESVEAVRAKLSGRELIIGIGSGVIQDLCKYVSYLEKIPYYIVATAPSMDGYASSGSAMISHGMKVTYSAKVPDGFIGDTEILKNAPLEMIKAGYGDIIGKYSALNDWKLSNAVLGEYLCDFIYNMTLKTATEVLPLAKKLLKRDENAIRMLTEALIIVGIAMSYAGNSRPASGSEHHLSHFFEITGILNNQEYLPHGLDVIFSTLITAKLREELKNAVLPSEQFRMTDELYRSEMERVYTKIADGCIALHEKTGWYKTDRLKTYMDNWEKIRSILSEIPSPADIEKMLFDIDLNTRVFYSTYSKAKLLDAVTYAKDLKDRFTVLWMYYDIFGKEVNL